MTDDTVELKPCPFCGSPDVMLRGYAHIASIVCRNCGASCGGVYPDNISRENLAVQAKRQWNTRSAMPQQEVTVKSWLVVHKEPTREQIIKFLEQATRNSSFEGPWDDVIEDTPAALRAISEGE